MAFDLDDVFAYTTFQVVRIRDRRLGIPYYVFMLAITGYIISSIITDQLYLKTEPPTAGSIRINLATPSALRNRTDISYCNGGSGTMSNVACGYLSAQIAAPLAEEGTSFVTTRLTLSTFDGNKAGCPQARILNGELPASPECMADQVSASKRHLFMADIERYTLRVEHTVQGQTTGISMRNSDMTGRLLNSKGQVMKTFFPDGSSKGDIVSLGDFLTAGDVNLDATTDVPGSASDASNTLRYDGIVLVVYIKYMNSNVPPTTVNGTKLVTTESNSIQYEYTVRRVLKAEYKFESPDFLSDGTGNFVLFNRHGVRLVFKQIGKIGQFDFMSLLVNVVAATALIKLAVTAVEILMMYVLPERKMYAKCKIHDTADFSTMREQHKQAQISPVNAYPTAPIIVNHPPPGRHSNV